MALSPDSVLLFWLSWSAPKAALALLMMGTWQLDAGLLASQPRLQQP